MTGNTAISAFFQLMPANFLPATLGLFCAGIIVTAIIENFDI